MAQYKGRTQATDRRRQTTQGRNVYVQGSVVKKLDERIPDRRPREPRKDISHTARKNRDKAYHMSLGYVFFLACAIVAVGFILTGYLGLQSDITNSIKNVSRLERELNNLKLANDEEYNRITSSIDIEEVKRIAIQELGMRYAEEGQIIVFSGEGSDFVRQIADIPE